MRRKIYRSLAVATVIACMVMALFSWYVVGIIEKENIKEILENRVSNVSDMLYKTEIKYKNISSGICDEYKSRGRALAIMLSENSNLISDELQLEELRMAIGAEAISFYNENFELEYTTGSAIDESKYINKFKKAVSDKLYSSAVLDSKGEMPRIIVGCSRLDKPGIILMEYISENVDTIFSFLDISKLFIDIPIMKNGSIALIENETMEYIAHTDEDMIGKPSHFNLQEDFFGSEPFKDCEINGEDVMMYFDFRGNRLVVGYVPYSEIYATRNDTIYWVIAAALILSVVVTLTVRSKVLHLTKKAKEK